MYSMDSPPDAYFLHGDEHWFLLFLCIDFRYTYSIETDIQSIYRTNISWEGAQLGKTISKRLFKECGNEKEGLRNTAATAATSLL